MNATVITAIAAESNQSQSHQDHRWQVAVISIFAGILFVALMSILLQPCKNPSDVCENRFWGDLFVDRSADYNSVDAEDPSIGRKHIYPLTMQNLMWIFFFVGLGEIWLRLHQGRLELAQLDKKLLPEDDEIMLRLQDLGSVYQRIKQTQPADCMLQRFCARGVLQFLSGRSVDRVNTLFNSSLELISHEIELKYNMLRYIVWLIPTLGFIGTVIGIAMSLNVAGDVPDILQGQAVVAPWMKRLTSSLGVAFYTTLLALLMSAVLVFLLHIAQGREEKALNLVGQYFLDNLVNRLYER